MENKIEVSVIIPARNEEKFISSCLDSVISQDYPKDKLEILVVDGMSDDKTRKIVKEYAIRYSFIKLLDNPKVFAPFALNTGIKNAKGRIIMRMDAHGTYDKDYIYKCAKYLDEYKADAVGGVIKTMPSENNIVSKAIVISMSHVFATAGSHFRMGSNKPRWVDTVFGGCYRKETFDKIGLYNENLIRSQDMEFNLRLKKSGGRILLMPEIVAYYYPKAGLYDFFRHNFEDGVWAIYPLKFTKSPFKLRHYIPLIFVASILISPFISKYLFFFIVSVYLLTSLYFSAQIARKDIRYLFLMPVVFFARHFGYGLGSLWGLLTLWKIGSN